MGWVLSIPNLYHVIANYILVGETWVGYQAGKLLLLLHVIVIVKANYILQRSRLVRHGSGIKRANEPFSSPFPPITLSYGPKLAFLLARGGI